MLKSSLLEIIRTFSKEEFIRFEDFLKSPYFNKKENSTRLFQKLKIYYPEFSDENLQKEKIWMSLFPGTDYNYGIMKNLVFELSKLLEKFIVVEKAGQDKLIETKNLLSFLDEKNLPKLFSKKFDLIERSYDNNYFKRSNFGINEYYSFWHDALIMKHSVSIYTKSDYSLYDSFSLSSLLNFLINSFKLYQMLIVTSKSVNINFQNNPIAHFLRQIDKKSFEDILQNVKSISGTDHLYLKIYYNMYSMFINKSEETYLVFKDSLYDNLKLFSQIDLRDLHYCLLVGSDCVIDPEKNITFEKLSIFDSMIRLNILTQQNGVLAEQVFMHYINLSFQEFDINRINTFSGKFIDKLNKNIRSNSNQYIKALNLFVESRYDESLSLISQIDPNYFIMKLYLRYLKGMCLYKIEDYDLFLNDYDSVRHFIKNNDKLNSTRKIQLEKYYYFLNILFKLRNNFDRFTLLTFKKEATEFYKNERHWILAEINVLENKYAKHK